MASLSPVRIDCPRCGAEIRVPLAAELGDVVTCEDGSSGVNVRLSYERDDLDHECRPKGPSRGRKGPRGRRP
jgi:hypothetical protein